MDKSPQSTAYVGHGTELPLGTNQWSDVPSWMMTGLWGWALEVKYLKLFDRVTVDVMTDEELSLLQNSKGRLPH